MATAENGFGKEGQIVEHLAVSRNTCAVAIRKRIHLVDLNRPENVLGRLDAPSSRWVAGVAQLEFNPHPSLTGVLASSSNNDLLLWDTDTRKIANSFNKLYHRPITGLNWSLFDPNLLVCCSDDKAIKVVDARTGKPTGVLTSKVGASGVRWSPHDSVVLASTHQSAVNIWDTRMNKVTATTMAHSAAISSVDWSLSTPNEFATAAIGQEQCVKLWSVEFLRSSKADLAAGNVGRVRYTPFGRGLVTGRRGDSAEDAAGISLWSLDKISDDTEAVPVATFPGEHAFAWWAPAGKRGGEYRLVTWNSTASCLVVTPLTQEAGHAVGHTMHEWTLSSTPPKHDGNLGPGSPSTPSAGTRAPLSPQLTPSKLSEGARTLAQEFQELRRHGVEGVVTTRLDAAERVCEVQAVAEARARKPNFFVQLVVRLSMSFPAVYPNGAPPGIQVIGVEPATADRTEFKRRVKQELCEHAAAHVEDNQQCVRTSLVLLLKLVEAEAEALRDAKVKQLRGKGGHTTRPPTAAEKLQRPTCGASFCGVGRLVYFSNLPRATPRESLDPSSSNAAPSEGGSLARFFWSRTPARASSRASHTHPASTGASAPTRLPAAVSVFDLSGLLGLSEDLGAAYSGSGRKNDPAAQCRRNVEAAEAVGRPDLARTWRLAELIVLGSPGRSVHRRPTAPWAAHPCGGATFETLVDFYFRRKDVQTAATLCALGTAVEAEGEAGAGKGLGLLSTEAARRFAAAQLLYAEVLYRWDRLSASAAMRNAGLRAFPARSHRSQAGQVRPIEVATFQLRCGECKAPRYGAVCSNARCRVRTNVCAVCRQLVTARTVFCLECNHGGHPECLEGWRASVAVCPTGCGCRCADA